jgi:hypothetical protein
MALLRGRNSWVEADSKETARKRASARDSDAGAAPVQLKNGGNEQRTVHFHRFSQLHKTECFSSISFIIADKCFEIWLNVY